MSRRHEQHSAYNKSLRSSLPVFAARMHVYGVCYFILIFKPDFACTVETNLLLVMSSRCLMHVQTFECFGMFFELGYS